MPVIVRPLTLTFLRLVLTTFTPEPIGNTKLVGEFLDRRLSTHWQPMNTKKNIATNSIDPDFSIPIGEVRSRGKLDIIEKLQTAGTLLRRMLTLTPRLGNEFLHWKSTD